MPSNLAATQILTLIEGREAARRTNAFETLCYRRILKVSGINKLTIKEIFDTAKKWIKKKKKRKTISIKADRSM